MVGTGGWMRRGERVEGWEGAGSRALEGGITLRGQGQGDGTMGTKGGRRGDSGCAHPQQQIAFFRGFLVTLFLTALLAYPQCKNLGVRVLPFFQLFRGAEGKVRQRTWYNLHATNNNSTCAPLCGGQ